MSDPGPREKTWLNALLFVLTCLTIWIAGLSWGAGFLGAGPPPSTGSVPAQLFAYLAWLLRHRELYQLGGLYAVALMTILLGHELGHYLTCRRQRIRATLPFFLPGPIFLGTFGAFIRIKSPLYFKRQVFDVGANGPLTGFALTLPVLAIGVGLSRIVPLAGSAADVSFGEPLLLQLIVRLVLGPIPAGSAVILHPIGWAGWVGLLVTALNLLPIGQLDGGHVAYAVLGRRARALSRIMVGLLGLMALFFHVTWLVLAVIILVFEFRTKMALRHPPVLNETAPLGRKRTILGVLVLVAFVLAFVPAPTGGYSLLDLLRGKWGSW